MRCERCGNDSAYCCGPDYTDEVELLLEVLENLLNRVAWDMDAKNWFLDEQEAARKAIEKVRAT
jgi:hypothetical protein